MAAGHGARPADRIESEMRRIRALITQRAFAESLAACMALLGEVPENRDILYLAAVSQRCLGRIADALSTLERLEAGHHALGRVYQERGHCYRRVGENALALAAHRRAVALNPTLSASWSAIEGLAGGTAPADAALAGPVARRHFLLELPRALYGAYDLYYEGELAAAAHLIAQFLISNPEHIEALHLQALIAARLDALEEAQTILEHALARAPDHRPMRQEYAAVLLKQHDFAAALPQIVALMRAEPANRDHRAVYAATCLSLGREQEALQVYRDLALEEPGRADWVLAVGYTLQVIGRSDEAVESYRQAVRLRPDWGEAYWSLANLKTYRFSPAEVEAMRTHLAAPDIAPADRCPLEFALGKALEDLANYTEAFRCYERGNALKRSQVAFEVAEIERNTRLQKSLCTRAFFAERRGFGAPDDSPIFIVGLPRSGSTLLEQILASHSRVEGTRELAHITRLANRLGLPPRGDGVARYPAVLAELDAEEARRLGERYLEETRPYRTGHPRFIDKMPGNFRHLGLIHLMLPNARIIDARRSPMACCVSNFKQLFAAGHEFTYSLEDLARYYRSYVELMTHWQSVLPARILRIDHERVVQDLEGEVRRVLEFCGLDFEVGCLEFYKTGRAVHTASSEQVRRPVSSRDLEHWRSFEPWLGELRAALGDPARAADL
jgi:tetratricopeptide (TPR) repeat protein